MPHGLQTNISSTPSPLKSAAPRNRLSIVLSSQPVKRVPLGFMAIALKVSPSSLRMPMPHGLRTMISSAPSPSKSPTGPKRLSSVLSNQPSKRVPLRLIRGLRKVEPWTLRIPMPQGLVTRISWRPSPSKSPTGPNRLSPVLSNQPPKRVPLGLISGLVKVLPENRKTPMPQGLVTRNCRLAPE